MKMRPILIFLATVAVFSAHTTLYATQDYSIELSGQDNVVGVIIPSDEYLSLYNPATAYSTATRGNIVKFLYEYFQDHFDYIILVGNNGTVPSGLYAGLHRSVSNNVAGIGKAMFNNSSLYGSAGRLKGVIDLPFRHGIRDGPALHELAHGWANYVVTTSYSSHWGFSSGGGQLGGFVLETLTDLGDGTFQANNGKASGNFGENANGGNSVPYSKIELYLMGLLDPALLPTLKVAQNPAWVDYTNGIFQADGFLDYTINDLVQANGVRSPSYSDAPNEFSILVVLVSQQEIAEDDWLTLQEAVSSFTFPGEDGDGSYNFWEATGGRANLVADHLSHSLIDFSRQVEGSVVALKSVSGNPLPYSKYKVRDIDGNQKIGVQEAIYALQASAGVIPVGPVYPKIRLANGNLYVVEENIEVVVSAYDPKGITGFYIANSASTPLPDAAGWHPVSPAAQSLSRQVTHAIGSTAGSHQLFCWFKNLDNELSDPAALSVTLLTQNVVFNQLFEPISPAELGVLETVDYTFDYGVLDPEGAYVLVIPFSGDRYTPGVLTPSNTLLKGGGRRSSYFRATQECTVDRIRFIMTTVGGSILYDEFIPVNYTFRNPS